MAVKWVTDLWTNSLLALYFSITPLHCSTPCRSWERCSVSHIPFCCLRGVKSSQPKSPDTVQHRRSLAAVGLCHSSRVLLDLQTHHNTQAGLILCEEDSTEGGKSLWIHRCSWEMTVSHNALGFQVNQLYCTVTNLLFLSSGVLIWEDFLCES